MPTPPGLHIHCDFNRSTQHLISKYKEEDVEYEVQTEDLLLRCTEGIDVGLGPVATTWIEDTK